MPVYPSFGNNHNGTPWTEFLLSNLINFAARVNYTISIIKCNVWLSIIIGFEIWLWPFFSRALCFAIFVLARDRTGVKKSPIRSAIHTTYIFGFAQETVKNNSNYILSFVYVCVCLKESLSTHIANKLLHSIDRNKRY